MKGYLQGLKNDTKINFKKLWKITKDWEQLVIFSSNMVRLKFMAKDLTYGHHSELEIQ